MTSGAILLFDNDCTLCDGVVNYILRHERAATIQFVSFQSDVGRKLAVEHNVDPDDPATFLFIEGGVARVKSDGVIATSRHVKGVGRLLALGRFVPNCVRDMAYEFVAQNRYQIFGKKNVCVVPSTINRDRFVL